LVRERSPDILQERIEIINLFGIEMLLNWFNNVSIMVMLLLLYNFIPDRFFIVRKTPYSLYVGWIFSFAAIMAYLIQYAESSQTNVGINAILIPLAGFFGGPVSAGIITAFLLLFHFLLNPGGAFIPEDVIFIAIAIIGCIFY
jgi:hypothetical protein